MIAVFDEAQRLHAPETFMVSGKPQPIPETPARIDMLLQGVRGIGLQLVVPDTLPLAAMELVHTRPYLAFLDTLLDRWSKIADASAIPLPNTYAMGRASLAPASYPESVVGQAGYHLGDGACPVTPTTLQSALASAASAIHGAKLVLGGEALVYALCRPPGHHAASDVAAGFCYFNNSALAAETFTRAGKRTAILDIDVHHGNGTEAVFYDRADVLTVSIHAHPKRFYPFFWGYEHETGRGAGDGFNLNLPAERGTAITEYCRILETALERISRFQPDVLVVAAGLDIAVDDPFKGFSIATPEFATIGAMIAQLPAAKLVVQEGGYPSPSLGNNLVSLLKGFGA